MKQNRLKNALLYLSLIRTCPGKQSKKATFRKVAGVAANNNSNMIPKNHTAGLACKTYTLSIPADCRIRTGLIRIIL